MQFKVPQFLEIEDKIFGPFTFKEFVYLVGGGGICFVIYKLLGFILGFLPMLAVAGFALALTFYRPNNKPFIEMVEAGFKYAAGDKLFIWKRGRKKVTNQQEGIAPPSDKEIVSHIGARLSGNKLRDLAWSLDVLDLKKQEGI